MPIIPAQAPSLLEEHTVLVKDCMARESRLNDWERSFIQSINERLATYGGLSDKQANRLNEIWSKATAKG